MVAQHELCVGVPVSWSRQLVPCLKWIFQMWLPRTVCSSEISIISCLHCMAKIYIYIYLFIYFLFLIVIFPKLIRQLRSEHSFCRCPAGIGKVASVFLTCGGERICRSASVGPRFLAGLSMDSSQIAFFFGQCASWRCGWWTDNEWHFEVWWRIRDIGRLRRRSGFLSWPWNFFWHGWSRWAGFG